MKLPIKPIDEPLYVIAVISNPRRYLTRYDLYRKFAKYVADSGAILVTVEAAFADRPHEVTEAGNPFHVQVRTSSEVWHKENLVNLGLARLPADWKYVAWIDADISFARNDWVQETIQMLQHHPVVQMFSQAQDLGPDYEVFASYTGIIKNWQDRGSPYSDYNALTYCGREHHPGFAWAATREAMDQLGGVIDCAIAGAGDRHMALALIGMWEASIQKGCSQGYSDAIKMWAERAAVFKGNVGYVKGTVSHFFHGKKSLRGYNSRWSIIVDNQFDPFRDWYKDSQGLYRLNDSKPKLKADLMKYLASRNEDDISMD